MSVLTEESIAQIRTGSTAHFDFSNCVVGPNEMMLIGAAISFSLGSTKDGMSPIMSIDLSRNKICGIAPLSFDERSVHIYTGLQDFVNSLLSISEMSHIERLVFSQNNMGPQGADIISSILGPTGPKSLTEISLADCNLDCFAVEELFKTMLKSKCLTRLDLRQNDFSSIGKGLGVLLKNRSLKTLFLDSCNLGSTNLQQCSSSFAKNNCLSNLGLAGNNLGDVGAEAIALVFSSKHSRLKYIDLQDNNITKVGLSKMCEALKSNTSLETLGLQWNQLRDDCISVLVACVSSNTFLDCIQLCGNNISGAAVKLVLDASKTRRAKDRGGGGGGGNARGGAAAAATGGGGGGGGGGDGCDSSQLDIDIAIS